MIFIYHLTCNNLSCLKKPVIAIKRLNIHKITHGYQVLGILGLFALDI